MAEISSGKPYTDIGIIRLFSSEVDSEELVWHRDKEHRKITVLEGINTCPVKINQVEEIRKIAKNRIAILKKTSP